MTETTPVRLISCSSFQGYNSLEDYIAYVARISNPSSQSKAQNSKRLLSYLIKHQHWSPFEMANLVLEIKTTRDIARQILRHRSFSFQEFSQRYSAIEEEHPALRMARAQDTKNRQNSLEIIDDSVLQEFTKAQTQLYDISFRLYKQMLNLGIAKECARALLPEGLTSSRLYVNGTIRSWIHYVLLRTAPETQLEHRTIALACKKVLLEVLPCLEELL